MDFSEYFACAVLKKFNDQCFEDKGSGVTGSLSISPGGPPEVSCTGKNKAKGVGQIKKSATSGGNE
ncbi:MULTISPECIES: hypothetical protein [unclassified Pseudomonas]|uniref:hypothetical protein n=1 Tax=unclassified Pseudomonas TaxID=196821 RepID=UPI000534E0CF|nr:MULTISPECIES: hypothetical protein [unclassified Pseudomonas]RAS22707.1 hypothetical protein H040_04368 [Pseudomonas sp. URMO17WK12:I7]SMF68243.1 hypothetical protein SAMN02745903_05063 [Pseudomonas sp. URMO17WK12:I5]